MSVIELSWTAKNSHGGIKIENEWTHVINTFPSKTLWDRLLKHFELNEYLKPFPQAHNYNKTCFRRNWSPKRGAPTASGWRRERSSRRREKTSRETWRVGSSREPCPTSKERSSTAGTSRGEGGRRQCSRLCASPGKVLTATSIFLENCFLTIAIIQDDVSQPVLGVWWDHGVRQRGVRPRPHRDRLGHDQGHQVHHGDHSHQHKHIIR